MTDTWTVAPDLSFDEDAAPVIPNNYLSAELIAALGRGASKPLCAQLITTLFYAKKGGYSIASLVATQGGTRKYIASILRELQRTQWVVKTTAKSGFASIWRLTPAARTRLEDLDRAPQAIKGASLKALHRLYPCRHDALIIRAQILVRIAYSNYHVHQVMTCAIAEGHLPLDERELPYDNLYTDSPDPADLYAECPAAYVHECLPGLSDRTVRRAIEQLHEEGLILVRHTKDGDRYALTKLGCQVVAATPEPSATTSGELRPSTQNLAPDPGQLRPSPADSYAHSPDSYAHGSDSYAHLEESSRNKKRVKKLEEGAFSIAALTKTASPGEEALGQTQTQEQPHPLSTDQIQEQDVPAETRETQSAPVLVDGEPGWLAPSGIWGRGSGTLLKDPQGISRYITTNRISATSQPRTEPSQSVPQPALLAA